MATSPNYGWLEPDNTDLVKNGALAIRTLGNAIDTTMATMIAKSLVDAKGDLVTATANDTPARLAIGTDGSTLVADSAAATGLAWSTITVTTTGTQTLTNKTLTSPISNTATINNAVIKSPEERCTVSATAATGTIAFDTQTQGVLLYTTNATANFTLNFTNVNANLAVGDSISCVFLNTNGGTAYYPTAFQVDSVAVTPKWSGGTAPSAGNASSIDSYSFTIIKTAATPTYTVLAGGAVKFA